MGRAKILMSHTRNITMLMTHKNIKYSIPLYTEKESLGKLVSTEIKDNEIILTYAIAEKPIENKSDFIVKFN